MQNELTQHTQKSHWLWAYLIKPARLFLTSLSRSGKKKSPCLVWETKPHCLWLRFPLSVLQNLVTAKFNTRCLLLCCFNNYFGCVQIISQEGLCENSCQSSSRRTPLSRSSGWSEPLWAQSHLYHHITIRNCDVVYHGSDKTHYFVCCD